MAGFGFASIEHFFASTFHDIHVGLQWIAKKGIPAVESAAPVVEGLTTIVAPQAVALERAAFQALGLIVAPINSADQAVLANGLNITLDAQTVAEFKALFEQYKSEFTAAGLSTLVASVKTAA